MADHALVTWTLDTIANNYTSASVSTSTPVLEDDTDGMVSTIDTAAGTRTDQQRRYDPDLADVNIVTVDANPDRQPEPIGTEYDLRVTDAVGILIEGLHADQGGEIDGPTAFRSLRRHIIRECLLAERTSYPTIGGVTYHTIVPRNGSVTPEAQNQSTYFAYSADLEFRAYEELS
ncbi:MAG: hypothetical protein V5A34_05595 [Halapricum sp.]